MRDQGLPRTKYNPRSTAHRGTFCPLDASDGVPTDLSEAGNNDSFDSPDHGHNKEARQYAKQSQQ